MLLTGLALAEAISVPPDFTKPVSRRPREMTSAVAYSSATRTGSFRTEIRVPRLRMRTWRVWRARIPTSSGLAPSSELIPAWCSTASTLSPRSSHRRNSSMTSSKRSAAIFGSQYLFGRLARTESAALRTSCGTNGYGTSHCHQASIGSLSGAASAIQELRDGVDEGLGLLDLWMVPRPLDDLEARVGDQVAIGPSVRRLHDAVARPPQHEGRHRDAAEQALDLGIIQIRMPAVETERFPVPGAHDQLVVREGVEVGRPFAEIVPAPPLHFQGRGVEDVEDVRGLAIADLDAERVHEDELVQTMTALDGHFCREPAPEGQPDERHLLVRQSLEDVQIEVRQIVHRLEPRRARRPAEARVRGSDDLGVPAEQLQEARPRIDGLHAVQEQDRPAGAPAHDLQLHARDRQPLQARRLGCVRHGAVA